MADAMYDVKNMTLAQLREYAVQLGLEPYRAHQIFQWLYPKQALSFDQMTTLSGSVRKQLAQTATLSHFNPDHIEHSRDGSKKFRFMTPDGHGIESVLIPEKKHTTLCISTQIGCPIRCRFCYTGRQGLVRNLSAAEIVNQVCAIMHTGLAGPKLPNLVYMGMGEPLANYDNTLKSLKILMSPWGYDFSHRKITVSTVGLVPQMRRLGAELPVNLAVSLNASNDEVRTQLMPVNRVYPLRELLAAAQAFPHPPRKRITFEYILIQGINDAREHAHELARRLKSIPCKINLIPFNEHPGVEYRAPDEARIQAFQAVLLSRQFTAPVRRSKGSDIAAACGQLGGFATAHSP
jgi:23S rRNA (adenine2503-C2)-methyltransferase